ncbi:MAG: 4a-hydroxytetrahydrobiopterin dehydratase [Burkholderiales bacterium]|nr:4a-hydroxytetrahydrobiopterin dehydratase [Burkholderiales bacterium]
MPTINHLLQQTCRHLETALTSDELSAHLALQPSWKVEAGKIVKTFSFENYYQTLAFVNGIALVIHRDDHHPELVVTYNRCVVKFDTHSVNGGKGGLSENDFICAAKVDAIFAQGFAHAN